VIGVDWRTPLDQARTRLGDGVAVQGNLEPLVLYAPRELMARRVEECWRRRANARGHIFNLGTASFRTHRPTRSSGWWIGSTSAPRNDECRHRRCRDHRHHGATCSPKPRPDVRVTLIEKRDRIGGNHRDRAPRRLLARRRSRLVPQHQARGGGALPRARARAELIVPRPEARKVYLVHDGRLELDAGGMALAVPTRIGPMLRTPLLSFPGKLRMLGDLLMPAGVVTTTSRSKTSWRGGFGREAARNLAGAAPGRITPATSASQRAPRRFPS